MNTRPILIMAGGTGGHVFPALAVAEILRARQVPVVWMGTRHGLEAERVPQAGFPIAWVSVSGVRGKSKQRYLLAPFMLTLALFQALKIIWRWRPAAVLGMGGFVTGPGGIGAWLLRKPLLIHEQNAIPGLTNRWLAHVADQVLEAFPGSFTAKRAVHTGNPVRPAIAALPPPQQRFAARGGALRLLVLGGSLGARALNRLLPEAIQRLTPSRRPAVWHQAGRAHYDEVPLAYKRAGMRARIEPFIEDMAAAYAWADLVVCRAGAMTVAELSAAGVAAVLVPYPHAADDHQTHNARFLSAAGAAIVIDQKELTAARLGDLLQELAGDRPRLLRMACAARACARPDAAAQVAGLCLAAAEGGAHE